MDQALLYVSEYLDNLDKTSANIVLFPDHNDPVENDYYQSNLEDMQESLAKMQESLENASEENRAEIEQQIQWQEESIADWENYRYSVTAEQIAYVAQLQRSGDEAGALQAANEAATKGFDDQTRRLKENMGTLETWADRTARAFKSMWDAVLDIGRPDTAQEMLIKAEAAFKKADDIWNLRKDDYFVNDEARARYWDDREKARLALEAARKKAEQQSQQDKNAQQQSDTEASRLKYTEEAQKAYERLQTPLEKYAARQEELNKALKDGKILQADYNTLMAAAKKDYETTLKKPKQSGVKVSAGDRQEDSAHAALLTLQAELRTLEKHAGANEKISQQRRDLWKAESQFAVLEEAAQRRQLSVQEKSLLAHKDETLEYKRQLAALGDKVTYQER